MRFAVLALLASCVMEPVPLDREPLEWHRHGHLVKGGVDINGFTCGERYAAAVQGVPSASDEMATCRFANIVYGSAVISAIAAGAVTLGTGASGIRGDIGGGIALTSIIAVFVAAEIAGSHLNRAVEVYNRACNRDPRCRAMR